MQLLVLTLGDRYGVGPEIVARLLEDLPNLGVRVVVVGDRNVFERGRADVSARAAYVVVRSLSEVEKADAPWVFFDRPFPAEVRPLAHISAEAGREVLETLDLLAREARDGTIGGLVYAPLNKQAMRLAGHEAGDELDFFSRTLPAAGVTGEINILGDLFTSRVTSHVPLRAVADLITRESVTQGVELMAQTLQRAGKASPRIAVAALNPHAGEGGAFGMEEIEVIAPAVAAAQARQVRAEGPFPADTIFPRAAGGAYDGVVTMFHDQGQIALKMAGLGQGITLLAGFPLPIATPGHGTAYDIAGTGMARIDGLRGAVQLVARMMRTGN